MTRSLPVESSRARGRASVRVMVLGPARFSGEPSRLPVPFSTRRALLMGLLADAGAAGISGARLRAWLWPEASDEKAHNALKQLLFKIRTQLGVRDAILTGPALRLNAAVVTTDLWDVLDAAARRDAASVLRSYGGVFLEGAEAWEPHDLALWLEAQRARAVRLVHEAAECVSDTEAAANRPEGVLRVWAQLNERLPSDEWVRSRLLDARKAAGLETRHPERVADGIRAAGQR